MSKKKITEKKSLEQLHEEGWHTIFDLNLELQRRLKEQATPKQLEKLEKLKETRKEAVSYNRRIGQHKRKKRKELADEIDKMSTAEMNQRFNYIKKKQQTIDNIPLVDLKLIDNQANQIAGKDFEYVIQDGATKHTYKIHADTLIKKKDPALFIAKRYQKALENALKKTEQRDVSTYKRGELGKKRHIEGTEKLLRKMENVIHTLETGEEVEDDETPPFILIEFVGEILIINY